MRIVVKDLIPGRKYNLQFRSKSADEASVWSPTFPVTISKQASKPLAPTGVSLSVVGDSFHAKWNRVTQSEDGSSATDLTGYVVQFRNTLSGQTAIFDTTDTKFELTFNLNFAMFTPIAGTVGVKVAARNNLGAQSEWSVEAITQNPPPGPVRNLAVKSLVDAINSTWDAPAGLEGDFKEYRAHVGTTSDFVTSPSNMFWSGVGTTATYQTTSSSIDHYVKVVAVDKFDSASAPATAGPVRPKSAVLVDAVAPATPTNLNGTISGQRLTATWTAPANPDADLAGYQIGYRPVGATGWSYATASHEDTSVVIEPINRFVNYETKVQAHDFSFNYSAWSANKVVNGEVNTPPAVPTGLQVRGAITSAMVVWNANTDIDLAGYEVQWKAESAPVDADPVFPTGGRNMSFSENVVQNTRYYARVRAVDTQGLKSAWSAPASDSVGFVDIPEVQLSDGVAPASSPTPKVVAGVDALYVSWPAVTNNDLVTYEAHISTTSNFTLGSTTKFADLTGTAISIRTLANGTTPLAQNTTYYVRLIAKDVDGAAAPGAQASAQLRKIVIGDTSNVKTDGAAPASSPVATLRAGVGSIFSQWNAVTNADPVIYEVHIGTTTGFTPAAGTKVGETSSTFNTIQKLPDGSPLAYDTNYYVRLIAKDADGAAAVGAASNAAAIEYVPRQVDLDNLSGRIDDTVTGSVIQYAVNSSETVAPTTGWSANTPTRTPGTFVWFRTVLTYADGSGATSNAALLTGNTGATGGQGIPGTPGADGTSLYTWIKFADTPTTGISDTPDGKTYMGIAYNKPTASETDTYADYSWSLIKGSDGKGISNTVVNYTKSSSGTVTPTTGWGTTIPTTVANEFLWTRTVTTYTDATTSEAYSVAKHGTTGSTGAAGRGITGTVVDYAASSSGTVEPASGWSSAIPVTAPGQFLWTRTVTSYNIAPLSTTAYSVAKHGDTGQQGIPGNPGADGVTTYTWVKYSNSPDGTTPVDDPAGMKYIGLAFNKTTQTESTNKADYQWSLIQGPQGVPGANAATVSLTATTQVLVSPATGGATNPATSVVTGTAVNTTITAWTYSIDGSTTFLPGLPTGVTRAGNVVTITGATMTAKTITVRMADANGVSDTLTVAKVLDGAKGDTGNTGNTGPAGADAYTVLLSNEAMNFAGSTTAAIGGTETTSVMAFKGATAQTVSVGTITTGVTGISAAVTAGNNTTSPTITVTVTTALTTQTGSFNVPLTIDGKSFTKVVSWSVSRTGAQGSQGIPGNPGADAIQYYTWLKYADSPTTGISDSPVGKTYMGIATNKTSATESENYADYTWTLIKGADGSDGKGISGTLVMYQTGTSATVAPTGTWNANPTATTVGQFLWTRTVTTYTDATTSTAYAVSAHGATGSTGAAGRGITSTVVEYQKSNSGTVTPSTWLGSIPATVPGEYLWTKTTTNYSSAPLSVPSYSVAKHGDTGQQGIPGNPGADGTTTYTWVKYSNAANGANPVDSPVGMTYIGLAFNKTTQVESTTPGDYQWSLIQGPKGDTGETGANAPAITLTSTAQALISPPAGGATTPATAVITGEALNTTIATWEYSVNGGVFVTTPLPTGLTRSGNTVTITGQTMTARTIAVKASGGGVSDTLTVAQVTDGAKGDTGNTGSTGPAGADAYTVILTNEAQVFPGTIAAAIAASPATTFDAVVYKGATQINATIGTITGHKTGLTTVINNTPLSPRVTVNITTALTQSGELVVPVVADGKTFEKKFSWSVSFTGATGATGAAGKGISSTTVTYQTHSNGTTAPTGTWQAAPTATTPGQFLWTRTITTFTDGSTNAASPAYSVAAHGTTGATGGTGAAGRGITGTTVNYAVSTSGTVEPTTGWVATPIPSTSPGQFLWTRTVTTYSAAPTSTSAYSVAAHGATGATGDQGVSVSSVTPFYRTVAKGAAAPAQPSGNADPAGWTKTEPAFVLDTELYRTERVSYSNNTSAWTPVTKVASYEAAAAARAIAITADNRVRKANVPPIVADGENAPTGALWYEYGAATEPGTGTVLKQTYEWTGSAWQPRGIDRTFLPAVDIGTGTFGDLTGARLVANTVKAAQIDTADLTANSAFINTLKVNAANVQGTLTIGQLPSTVAEDADVAGVESRALSRGTDLITNGTAYLGDNTNFSAFDFNASDSPSGTNGSFVSRVTTASTNDEFIPVDVTKPFKVSFWARQTATVGARMYGCIYPYDAFNNQISPQQYMFAPGTTTTLAQELKPGDTTVKLTSAANWYGQTGKNAGGSTHFRSFAFWNYVDPSGKVWGPETYTREPWVSNLWADGAVDLATNTITLNAPWTGKTYAAGHPVSNGSSGSSIIYIPGSVNVITPAEWTQYSGVMPAKVIQMVATGGNSSDFNNGWPPSVAKVKIGWLMNRHPTTSAYDPTSKMAFAGVSMSDAAAAQVKADAVDTLTSGWKMTGKTTIDGGKIETDTITAAQIKANSIDVSRMMISDLANYAENPLPSTVPAGAPTGWDAFPAGVTLVAGTNTTAGNGVIRMTGVINSFNKYMANSMRIPVVQGDKFLLSMQARTVSGRSATGSVGFLVHPRTSAGTGSATTVPGAVLPAANGATLKITTEYTVPANVATVSFGPWLEGSQNGAIEFFDFQFRRKTGTVLIEDGAITADLIDTNAVKATHIDTDAIEARHIKAGSITIGVGAPIAPGTVATPGDVTTARDAAVTTAGTNAATAISTAVNPINTKLTGWTAAGFTTIDGGKIQTDTIKAGSIDTADLTANAGFISNLTVTNANISSLEAHKLTAGNGIVNNMNVKSTLTLGDASTNGVIQSHGYSGTTAGFKIDKTGVVINEGSIEARTLKIQTGQNLLRPEHSDFELPDSFYNPVNLTPTNFTTTAVAGGRFNKQHLACRATTTGVSELLLGTSTTDYNIPAEAGKIYILSAYVKGGPVASQFQFRLKWSNGTFSTLVGTTTIAASSAWQRITGVTQAAPAGTTGAIMSIYCSTSAVNSGFDIDGLQVEEQFGALTTPSAWTPPGMTMVDGGMIRTGEIRSNANVTLPGAGVQPMWVLSTAGNMQVNEAVVRGKLTVGQAGNESGAIIQSFNYVQGTSGFMLRGSDGYAEFRNLAANIIGTDQIKAGVLSASNIEAGTLNVSMDVGIAGKINVGSAGLGLTTIEGGSTGGIKYYLPEVTAPVSEFGRDWVSRDVTGRTVASITSDGSVTGITGDFNNLRVNGDDVAETLAAGSKVILLDEPSSMYASPSYTVETYYRDIGFKVQAGHVYKIENWLNMMNTSTASGTFFAYLRHATQATAVPATLPGFGITARASQDTQISNGAEGRFNLSYFYVATSDTFIRVGVSGRSGGSRAFQMIRSIFAVTDMGLFDPQPGNGSWSYTGVKPTVRKKESISLGAYRVYQNKATAADQSKVRIGMVGSTYSNPFGTAVLVPELRAAIVGKNVVSVKIRMTNTGTARAVVALGHSSATTLPATMPAVGWTGVTFIPAGGTRLISVPPSFLTAFQAGTIQTIYLGQDNSSTTYAELGAPDDPAPELRMDAQVVYDVT